MSVREYNNCFACGKDNEIGLKLKFVENEGKYQALFTPSSNYQSYDEMLHGGIIATLLDEVMVNYVLHLTGRVTAFTAKLEVRYRKPVKIGAQLRVEATVSKHKANLYEMEGKLYQVQENVLVAQGTAKVMLGAE